MKMNMDTNMDNLFETRNFVNTFNSFFRINPNKIEKIKSIDNLPTNKKKKALFLIQQIISNKSFFINPQPLSTSRLAKIYDVFPSTINGWINDLIRVNILSRSSRSYRKGHFSRTYNLTFTGQYYINKFNGFTKKYSLEFNAVIINRKEAWDSIKNSVFTTASDRVFIAGCYLNAPKSFAKHIVEYVGTELLRPSDVALYRQHIWDWHKAYIYVHEQNKLRCKYKRKKDFKALVEEYADFEIILENEFNPLLANTEFKRVTTFENNEISNLNLKDDQIILDGDREIKSGSVHYSSERLNPDYFLYFKETKKHLKKLKQMIKLCISKKAEKKYLKRYLALETLFISTTSGRLELGQNLDYWSLYCLNRVTKKRFQEDKKLGLCSNPKNLQPRVHFIPHFSTDNMHLYNIEEKQFNNRPKETIPILTRDIHRPDLISGLADAELFNLKEGDKGLFFTDGSDFNPTHRVKDFTKNLEIKCKLRNETSSTESSNYYYYGKNLEEVNVKTA